MQKIKKKDLYRVKGFETFDQYFNSRWAELFARLYEGGI